MATTDVINEISVKQDFCTLLLNKYPYKGGKEQYGEFNSIIEAFDLLNKYQGLVLPSALEELERCNFKKSFNSIHYHFYTTCLHNSHNTNDVSKSLNAFHATNKASKKSQVSDSSIGKFFMNMIDDLPYGELYIDKLSLLNTHASSKGTILINCIPDESLSNNYSCVTSNHGVDPNAEYILVIAQNDLIRFGFHDNYGFMKLIVIYNDVSADNNTNLLIYNNPLKSSFINPNGQFASGRELMSIHNALELLGSGWTQDAIPVHHNS